MYREVVLDGGRRPGGRVQGRQTGRGRDADPPEGSTGRGGIRYLRLPCVACSDVSRCTLRSFSGLVEVSKDGRLEMDGMLTHQGEAPGRGGV